MKYLESTVLSVRSVCKQTNLRNSSTPLTHPSSFPTFSGNAQDTRGTAFVVFEDIFDAKNACEHLQGFNILGRYLIVLYYQQNKITKKMNLQKKEDELKEMKA
jgi:RNA recognition motif-containing protein